MANSNPQRQPVPETPMILIQEIAQRLACIETLLRDLLAGNVKPQSAPITAKVSEPLPRLRPKSNLSGDTMLTIAELAEYLPLKVSRIRSWRQSGKYGPPSYKPAGTVLFKKSEVDKWWEANKQESRQTRGIPVG